MWHSAFVTAPAEALINEIHDAFPRTRPVSFPPLVNSSQGEEPRLVAAAFADKDDWTSLDPAWLDEAVNGEASALHFLSDEALAFYIPAYLVADIKGQLQRAEPSFQLTYGFGGFPKDECDPRTDASSFARAARRWAGLTRAQARAMVLYLEWCIAARGIDIEFAAAEALRTFWYGRAGKAMEARL